MLFSPRPLFSYSSSFSLPLLHPSFGDAFANELRMRSSTMTKGLAWAEYDLSVHRRRAESLFMINTLHTTTERVRYGSIELTGNLAHHFREISHKRLVFRIDAGEDFNISTNETVLLFFARAHLEVYGRVRTLGQIRCELVRDFRTVCGAIDSDTQMGFRSEVDVVKASADVLSLAELHDALRKDVISLLDHLPSVHAETRREYMRCVTG
jgi:hypothetical protein